MRSEHKVGGGASRGCRSPTESGDIRGERGGRGVKASGALCPKKRGSAQKALWQEVRRSELE